MFNYFLWFRKKSEDSCNVVSSFKSYDAAAKKSESLAFVLSVIENFDDNFDIGISKLEAGKIVLRVDKHEESWLVFSNGKWIS